VHSDFSRTYRRMCNPKIYKVLLLIFLLEICLQISADSLKNYASLLLQSSTSGDKITIAQISWPKTSCFVLPSFCKCQHTYCGWIQQFVLPHVMTFLIKLTSSRVLVARANVKIISMIIHQRYFNTDGSEEIRYLQKKLYILSR
jgi:hypothetical protein